MVLKSGRVTNRFSLEMEGVCWPRRVTETMPSGSRKIGGHRIPRVHLQFLRGMLEEVVQAARS
jgi:hypothetical protein